MFTSIGAYDYNSDLNSGLGGNGLTKADNRAFYSTMRLNGILTQTLGSTAMEYRFETSSDGRGRQPDRQLDSGLAGTNRRNRNRTLGAL